MNIAIHQPHLFPWLGYFIKMALVEKFVLLDNVQLTDSSYMHRNRLLDCNGKIKYFSKHENILVQPADNHCLRQPRNLPARCRYLRRQA